MSRFAPLLFVAILCAMPEDLPHDALMLARVRAHMSHLLTQLPNYTCLQTIERTQRIGGKRPELIDVVRIEVALVDGRELFAWPGSKKFEDTEIIDMVKGGAIGNGNFALHAKAVFQSSAPRFMFAGERIREDRKTLRWDFVVPQTLSGYTLKQGRVEEKVGFHGSFWADPVSLDVLRLEVYADDIPTTLQISSAADAVEYVRVKLGEEAFLLPKSSELTITSPGPMENRNRTTFSGCRQYTGESTLSFDDPDTAAKPIAEIRTLELPPGLRLDLALETPITDKGSAVGDPVTAILKKSVKLGSGLVIPKGAIAHGRLTHLRSQQTSRPGWVVGMTFFEMEWQDTRADFHATLEDTPSLSLLAARSVIGARMLEVARREGIILAPGMKLSLSRGFLMTWRTDPIPAKGTQ